jgi:ABC-2 type transport system ATP-binding protein
VGLTKDYGQLRAVDSLHLDVPLQSIFGFLGPNGAGKTTTIRMLLGLIRPTAGSFEILGHSVDRPGHPVLASVGALVEQPGFLRHLSGRRNLELYAAAGPEPDRPRTQRIDEVLALVQLTAAAGRKVKTYSHGMKQRLGVAQTLLNDPQLLVLDEPTDGLDPEGIRDMRELMRRLVAGGRTIFLSSHLLHEVEQLCDRAAVISRGQLIAAGTVSDLRGGVVLRLHTPDAARAVAVARNLAVEAREDGDSVVLHPGAVPPEDLVRAWVTDGVRVRALVPERAGLEQIYLELVGGKP